MAVQVRPLRGDMKMAVRERPLHNIKYILFYCRGAGCLFGPQTADYKEDGGGCQNGQQS